MTNASTLSQKIKVTFNHKEIPLHVYPEAIRGQSRPSESTDDRYHYIRLSTLGLCFPEN